ncbi:MAG TPA: hypothetical protein PKE38_15845 [Ignavibacteriaceae bacterium]|nr:hypothetical protein [Ignavibacteriaceae bacterium]
MKSIKALHNRIEKIENILLFKGEPKFYEKLNDEEITKLLFCLTRDELQRVITEPDDVVEILIEEYYNKYSDVMDDIFSSDQQLRLVIDEIDFTVKYMNSLTRVEKLRLQQNDPKALNKLSELIKHRRIKKGLNNYGNNYLS